MKNGYLCCLGMPSFQGMMAFQVVTIRATPPPKVTNFQVYFLLFGGGMNIFFFFSKQGERAHITVSLKFLLRCFITVYYGLSQIIWLSIGD